MAAKDLSQSILRALPDVCQPFYVRSIGEKLASSLPSITLFCHCLTRSIFSSIVKAGAFARYDTFVSMPHLETERHFRNYVQAKESVL